MAAFRIAGVLLLLVGLACFLTGGVTLVPDTIQVTQVTQAMLDPLELPHDKHSVAIPQWISLGAMVLGGMVLVLGFRSKA